MARTHIYAHRANGFGHLENSPAAIKAALAYDSDVELDIRLSKDRTWMVLHDAYLDRISTAKGLVVDHDCTTLRQLRLIDGQHIPSLADVLPLFANKKSMLLLELKNGGEEHQLVTLLKKHDMLSRTLIATWNPRTIETLKDINPHTRTCLFYFPLPRMLRLMRWHLHLRYDGDPLHVNINEHHRFPAHLHGALIHSHIPRLPIDAIGVPRWLIRTSLIREARARSIQLIAFDINNRAQARRTQADGLVTDRPTDIL